MSHIKRNGFGAASALVVVVSAALLASAAWFGAEAVKKRGLDKGAAALADGDYAQAAEYLARAEKFSLRADARVLSALGAAHAGLGDEAAAKGYYTRAVKADGTLAEARYKLGKIYIEEKSFEAARSEAASLEKLGTEEAHGYARELQKEIQIGSVKNIFDGIVGEILPKLKLGGGPSEQEDAR